MPRVMGVLTHLDMLKNNKQLKNTKKTLKHRFWTEVYAGAKLFYLSGLLHGEYLRNEVKNLSRFISIMKFRPLTWRTTHPYIVGMLVFPPHYCLFMFHIMCCSWSFHIYTLHTVFQMLQNQCKQ